MINLLILILISVVCRLSIYVCIFHRLPSLVRLLSQEYSRDTTETVAYYNISRLWGNKLIFLNYIDLHLVLHQFTITKTGSLPHPKDFVLPGHMNSPNIFPSLVKTSSSFFSKWWFWCFVPVIFRSVDALLKEVRNTWRERYIGDEKEWEDEKEHW